MVLQSKMDPFGLVVHQEVAGEMTCQMAKWAMVAEVAVAAMTTGRDGGWNDGGNLPLANVLCIISDNVQQSNFCLNRRCAPVIFGTALQCKLAITLRRKPLYYSMWTFYK